MTPATIATAGAIIVAIIAAWGEYRNRNADLATDLNIESRLTSLECWRAEQEKSK